MTPHEQSRRTLPCCERAHPLALSREYLPKEIFNYRGPGQPARFEKQPAQALALTSEKSCLPYRPLT